MSDLEQPREIDRLRQVTRALEAQAGLANAMDQARQGRLIPREALGDEPSAQTYLADEHDVLREETRDAYFSVADQELRKRLIGAQRKVESRLRQSLAEEIAAAEQAVAHAEARARRQPWAIAALLGVATVLVAYWALGTVGAIAGAVASYFLGQGVIADARNEAEADIARSARRLEVTRERQAEHSLLPDFFSRYEEISGNRDPGLDDELDYASMLGSPRRAPPGRNPTHIGA